MSDTEKKPKRDYKVGRGKLPPEYIGRPGPGRPKGLKNFKTYFEEAWKEIAESIKANKDPDVAKIKIILVGLKKALTGDYSFWRDIVERLFGKVENVVKIEDEKIDEVLDKLEQILKKYENT